MIFHVSFKDIIQIFIYTVKSSTVYDITQIGGYVAKNNDTFVHNEDARK